VTGLSYACDTDLKCDCRHPWAVHYTDCGCAMGSCNCTAPRHEESRSARIARIRAANPEPLVSHVDDRRNVLVGHYVTESVPDDSDYTPRQGVVVERWHTDDGEPGVVVARFSKRGRETVIHTARLRVDALRDEWLPPKPDPSTCATAYRKLLAVIAQRVDSKDRADVLNDYEVRILNWALALIDAAGCIAG
jgi:hypothetical protein